MTPWMRSMHKWVGLLVALQFVLWMLSGLMMSLLDDASVRGQVHRAPPVASSIWPADTLAPATVAMAADEPVQRVEARWLLDRPVYQLTIKSSTRMVDALTGDTIAVDAGLARALARADYVGKGEPAEPQLEPEPTLETRAHAGPIWRVDFDDADETTIYVSALDGRILERRNATWRLFDIFWMLHIMDYTGRQDFNNPLVVLMGGGGVWIALSGMWLLVASFRLSEFTPRRWRATRTVSVFDANGEKLRTLDALAGDNVYLSLARQGLNLPSNCGGGQSCGLCEVRFRGSAPPPTSADRANLPASRLKLGYRLACNLEVNRDVQIEVTGAAKLWTTHQAVVERVTAVTPFLREIVLRPSGPTGEDFRPGAYVQLHVPDYSLPREAIHFPEHHHEDWRALDLPVSIQSREAVRRSYSLSMPVEKSDGRVTLLVRFSPGGQSGKRHPPGKGSSYVYSLKAGDPVDFSGPYGDFAIKPGHREKIFIGGGAGMAPLRAMIHQLLDRGAAEPIHFWYGARTLREAPYVEEMEALAARHANFHWQLVLSEQDAAGAPTGLVHVAAERGLLTAHPALDDCDFYLCGPPAMLSATRQLLQKLGIPDERVAYDDFKI